MPSYLTALGPFVGLLVTLFLGLVVWRIQLIGKRRTELAEEALLAFAHAVDAVRNIRSIMILSTETEALRKEAGKGPEERLPGESYRISLRRIGENQERFPALRKLQILCGLHFGPEASKPFDDLNEAINRVAVAAKEGAMMAQDGDFSEEIQKLRREQDEVIWQGAGKPDVIADKVAAAQRELEMVLTPHLRANAALLPIAVSWRSGKSWLATRRRPTEKPPTS